MASKKQLSVGRPIMWIGIAVLSAGLAGGAWYLKSSGIESGVKAANRIAASAVKRELAPELTAADVREPMSEEAAEQLQQVVSARILNERITTLRIWTSTGTLVFSSTGEQTGTQGGNERSIRLATTDEGKTTSLPPSTGGGLLDIYTPLRIEGQNQAAAAVELIQSYAPIVEAAGQPWSLVQSAAGGLAAIALVMTIVSFALMRAGRFGKQEMGFARSGGGQVDDEKVRRLIGARDEQITQLREQIRENENETVERIRALEIQLREAAAKAVEAEARAADTTGSRMPHRKRTVGHRSSWTERCAPRASSRPSATSSWKPHPSRARRRTSGSRDSRSGS